MTPKEKAEELFVLYRFALSIQGAPLGDIKSKQCALIAVEEIIHDTDASSPFETQRLIFWNEVKTEIENYNNERQ